MKQPTKDLIKFLQDHKDENLTAKQIAKMTGKTAQTVSCTFTKGIVSRKLGERQEQVIQLPDNTTKKMVYLKLNEQGQNLDLELLDSLEGE